MKRGRGEENWMKIRKGDHGWKGGITG